jgi:hypothetical protein
VSGYWQTDKTLDRWCINQSYLISARNHGLTVAEAITLALAGTPWLPPITLPALAGISLTASGLRPPSAAAVLGAWNGRNPFGTDEMGAATHS